MKIGNLITIVKHCLGLGKPKSEKIGKGTKLLEVKASMSADKSLKTVLYFFIVLYLAYAGFTFFTWFQGRSIQTWQLFPFFWMPMLIFLLHIKRTYGVYDKGIKIMVRFYPWDTFKGYIAKNGQVAIYYKSFLGGRFVLPDNDGRIEKVIMEYLEPNPKLGLLD